MVPLDKDRFIQVCGMLGSDFDGERAAAALMATKMLRSAGMTWAELLTHVGNRANDAATEVGGKTSKDNGWRACDIVMACAEHLDDLSPWQQNFVNGTLPFAKRYGASCRLSPKQWAVFHRMAEELELGA